MTTLSKDQKAFLASQQIPLSTVFDATGMKRAQYYELMKDLGKKVAIGITPCRKFEHTMRTRNGACIQCNPAAMTFLSRHEESGSVYIAGSKYGAVIKVGYSGDVSKREKTLNNMGYGGSNDWRALYIVECQLGGQVESLIHKELEDFNTPRQYIRDGNTVDCLELFQCGYDTARHAFECVFEHMDITSVAADWESPYVQEYQFEDVLSDGAIRRGNNGARSEAVPRQPRPVFSKEVTPQKSITPNETIVTIEPIFHHLNTKPRANSEANNNDSEVPSNATLYEHTEQNPDRSIDTVSRQSSEIFSGVREGATKSDDEMSMFKIISYSAGWIGLIAIILLNLFGSDKQLTAIDHAPRYHAEVAASIALLKNIIAEGGESYYSYTDRSFADVLTMATLLLDELDPEDVHDVALIAGIWREGVVHGWCGNGCWSYDDSVSFAPNEAVSYKFATIAHDEGSGLGSFQLAELYAYSDAAPYDPEKTISLYMQAESRGVSASTDMVRWGQGMLISLGQNISADGDFGQNTCTAMQDEYLSHELSLPECLGSFSKKQLLQLEHWRAKE